MKALVSQVGSLDSRLTRYTGDGYALASVDIRCVMLDDRSMRTTLDIDDDILQAAKEIAANRRTTAGKVLSQLARKALEPGKRQKVRNGVPLLPRRPRGAPKPTMEVVNRLRDEA